TSRSACIPATLLHRPAAARDVRQPRRRHRHEPRARGGGEPDAGGFRDWLPAYARLAPARALAPLSARLLHTDTALAPTVPARLEPSAGGAHPRYRRRLAPLARRADAHERDPGSAGAALVGG